MTTNKQRTRAVIVSTVSAAALVAVAAMALAQTNAAQTIGARQDAMKAQGAAMKTLTQMVRGEAAWDQEAALKAASALSDSSKAIPNIFPQGTGTEAGKTNALPVIWQQWADFQDKAKALTTASEKLAQLARANDVDGVKAQFPNVGKACGGCHETYRAKSN